MQLSERVRRLKPSATFAISTRVKTLAAEGRDVIGFGAGEPDFDTPQHIVDVALEALRGGKTHYTAVAGDLDAREAIAAKLTRENGIACSAADVVISTGAKQSLNLALEAILDPGMGQEVLLLTPAWVSYRAMVELAGGVAVEVPASVENNFKVTADQLESAITDRTAALIINSPSNPCGTMYSPDELRAFADVVARHPHVIVIADEIYEKLIYGDVAHFSMGSVDAIADRVVTINGMSKAYAMTGWRLGYLCAPGDGGALAKAANKLQGQQTSHVTSFCQPAIVEALENGADAVESMRQVFARRAALITDLVAAWPDVPCPTPTGAFYIFPDMRAHLGKKTPGGRELADIIEFAGALLDDTGVAVVPGEDFGECARTHVRLSFACADEKIIEGCERIRGWLASLVG